ncbi:protein SENSITIVE TO UV 2 isoform X4 [Phoenix dactylifera]|uniref:Protein SENSITIVE TO UV 2 isoform X4 n=1 Tax=Phoenix dactylifera TaxID=42345 RepID=A0A8B8IZI0_PHODC|nr:protein SENSITIVE TO UV 2 isoform X4 [Phoenix dactylifera]
MSFEGIDEWDENFLDEAIRIELGAISSRNPSSDPSSSSRDHNAAVSSRPEPEPEPIPPRNPAPVRSDQEYFPPIPSFVSGAGWGAHDGGFSFSPPRELSQRFPERPNLEVDFEIIEPLVLNNVGFSDRAGSGGGGARKDKEVERLKRELGHVLKQLNHLEHKCMELKKDRAWKDEQLKCAFSQIEAKDAEIRSLKGANLDASKLDLHNNGSFVDQAGHSRINEDKGTQSITQALQRTTDSYYGRSKGANGPSDFVQDYSLITPKDLAEEHISSKLLAIWVSPNNRNTGRNLISKLVVSCSADFCVLFRCLSMTSKMDLDCPSDKRFADMALDGLSQPFLLTDAAKVSRLYAILMKMHKEVGQLHAFLEALLDLCTLENVVLVHRSLRILHAILQLLPSWDTSSNPRYRNNVLIDQSLKNEVYEEKSVEFENQIVEFHNSEEACNKGESSSLFSTDKRSFDLENLCKEKLGSNDTVLSSESWISIFGAMKQVALRIGKECVQIETLSIMILILMRSNPNAERKRFGLLSFLEFVPRLLQKEVGLHVQKQTVHLLFLLLNCPEMLMMFCSGGKVGMEQEETVDGHIDALQRAISSVLEVLSECLASGGTGSLELKLHKQIIILLAHIASYGQSGFEVLLNPVRPQGLNFLGLLVRVLASEMDAEITDFAKMHALCKERTSLMREALILLNRLASHPTYSRAALDALTSSNSTASLTIDVANRIPQKSRGCWKHGGRKTTQIEGEIMDLARLFRSRVFAFLGESHPAN